MNKETKNKVIAGLTEELNKVPVFYLADTSGLTVESTNKLRRICFNKKIQMKVIKNTLLKKAMEKTGKNYDGMYDTLHGVTSIFYSEGGNVTAKVIKEFRKKNDKPILKAAFIEETVFIGDNQLETLVNLKSKNELIGEIIGLLQSPAKNVVSALQSGKNKLAGIVKTLSERETN